jgi:hypothetical protein
VDPRALIVDPGMADVAVDAADRLRAAVEAIAPA